VAGGKNTQDRIFLLSISEVIKYFGDSGQLKNKNSKSEYRIDDQFNSARQAHYNGSWAWWWLRSPGHHSYDAAYVSSDGNVIVNGITVFRGHDSGGVRPALWLNLKSEIF
jgi:hypothetical protein